MLGNNPNFPYPPLPKGVNAIRILTIHPGDFSEPLVYTLSSQAFSEKPRYAALSYTWDDAYRDNSALPTSRSMTAVPHKLRSSVTWDGRSQDSQDSPTAQTRSSTAPELERNKPDPITLNAHPFLVHHNLHLCMLHLRSPTYPLTLWIDAVCINQDDTDESNQQVAIMSFIYSRAEKVIAWLGAKPYPNQQDPFLCMSIDWKAGESSRLAAALAGDAKMQYTSILEKHTLSRLADSRYWTRLWIVQEACLAYDLVFVHGSHVWGFDRIRMLDPLEGIPYHDTDERTRYDAMLRLIGARLARHTDVTRLENLVERFRKQACSDLKDRIYGLIGLANDVRPFWGDTDGAHQGKGRIKIDRLRSFYDIWKDVVKHVFFRTKPIPRHWTVPGQEANAGNLLNLDDEERSVSVVRTSGVVQEALGQKVEGWQVSESMEPQVPNPSMYQSGCRDVSLTERTQDPSMRSTIKAIGYVAGKIVRIGPDYESLVRSPEATHDWVECWDEYYHVEQDLQQLRAMNEEYMFRILRYNKEDLSRIRDIKSPSTIGWFVSQGKDRWRIWESRRTADAFNSIHSQKVNQQEANSGVRICLGTNHVVALVPPKAKVGDVVVRFWNCSASIVMRPFVAGKLFNLMLVGRADVARTIDPGFHEGTDLYAEKSMTFDARKPDATRCPSLGAVYVEMDFPTLQTITASIDAQGQGVGR